MRITQSFLLCLFLVGQISSSATAVRASQVSAEASESGTETYTFLYFAGRAGGPGARDGRGYKAQFGRPYGSAIAPDGTLYVADSDNHTIRSVTADGLVATVVGRAMGTVFH